MRLSASDRLKASHRSSHHLCVARLRIVVCQIAAGAMIGPAGDDVLVHQQ
jgi:hypothetical protein